MFICKLLHPWGFFINIMFDLYIQQYTFNEKAFEIMLVWHNKHGPLCLEF